MPLLTSGLLNRGTRNNLESIRFSRLPDFGLDELRAECNSLRAFARAMSQANSKTSSMTKRLLDEKSDPEQMQKELDLSIETRNRIRNKCMIRLVY